MACNWGSSTCAAPVTGIAGPAPVLWRYNRTICSGLGDRLGALLTVAALAHVARVEVEMEWCNDPSVTYQQVRPYMPGFYGWDYPLDEFLQTFDIPPNIRLVKRYSQEFLPEVSYTGNELPAVEAHDQLYTLASRTTKIGYHLVRQEDFVRAYHVVGSQLQSKVPWQKQGYIVLHMRGFDANTVGVVLDAKRDWDPSLFCTHKVIARALKQGLKVMVIGNNLEWAREELQSHSITFPEGSAFEDMSLMLSAIGIMQHAPRGYSSYSSVPAMAKGTPLLSTYKGPHHRWQNLRQAGELPSEFYTCGAQKAFLARVVERLKIQGGIY